MREADTGTSWFTSSGTDDYAPGPPFPQRASMARPRTAKHTTAPKADSIRRQGLVLRSGVRPEARPPPAVRRSRTACDLALAVVAHLGLEQRLGGWRAHADITARHHIRTSLES